MFKRITLITFSLFALSACVAEPYPGYWGPEPAYLGEPYPVPYVYSNRYYGYPYRGEYQRHYDWRYWHAPAAGSAHVAAEAPREHR